MVTELIKTKLLAEPSSEQLFIVDNARHDKEFRNILAEILFEKCQIKTLNFMSSTTLSLFSTGRTEYLLLTTEVCQ